MMRIYVVSASLMLWASIAQTQTPVFADTLMLEFGDRAKAIFLARDRADYDLIARYDLNALFQEMYRQLGVEDQSAITTLQKSDSELFRNPLRKTDKNGHRKFFEVFYFNFFMGFSGTTSRSFGLPPITFQTRNPDGRVYFPLALRTNAVPSFNYGLSLNTDVLISRQPGYFLKLKTSVGYENIKINLRPDLPYSGGYFAPDDLSTPYPADSSGLIIHQYLDSLSASTSLMLSGQHLNSPRPIQQFYLQLMPTITLYNGFEKEVLKFGFGIRGGLDPWVWLAPLKTLSGITDYLYDVPGKSIYIGRHNFQFGYVFQVGYRAVNFFATYMPNAYTLYESGEDFTTTEHRGSVLSMGIRLGR
ncbi:MAG TPA: hypothetical protein PKA00_07430 [Saprospiraceae bacterium]|nr:hypothetical protein [Saprospiraceae bacterium]HMQ82722.1 hypothetical protein [Saprospiraceae bacterium]